MESHIEYNRDLEKAGFSRVKAEAILKMAQKFTESNFATKSDFAELKHSIEMLEYKMTIKFGSMLGIAVGLLVALQKWT